ncbi:hypothetical protein V4U86_27830 [Mycobacterium sp. AMU20-3851]
MTESGSLGRRMRGEAGVTPQSGREKTPAAAKVMKSSRVQRFP